MTDSLYERIEDAAYVAVGAAVLTFQRAQVQRRELERWLATVRQELDDLIVDEEQPSYEASPKG